MRIICRKDSLDRNLYIAGCAILKTNRTGKPGGELAMDLALCRSRADGSPTDKIGHILWRNHIQELCAGRYSHLCQIEKKATCNAQSITDAERLIEVRIVDQPL